MLRTTGTEWFSDIPSAVSRDDTVDSSLASAPPPPLSAHTASTARAPQSLSSTTALSSCLPLPALPALGLNLTGVAKCTAISNAAAAAAAAVTSPRGPHGKGRGQGKGVKGLRRDLTTGEARKGLSRYWTVCKGLGDKSRRRNGHRKKMTKIIQGSKERRETLIKGSKDKEKGNRRDRQTDRNRYR